MAGHHICFPLEFGMFFIILMELILFVEGYQRVEDLVTFGGLEHLRNIDYQVNFMIEDVYNPGVFIVSAGHAVVSLDTLNDFDLEVIAGNSSVAGNRTGRALHARFNTTSAIAQYDRTKMAIIDFYNKCLKEYDSQSGNVSYLSLKSKIYIPIDIVYLKTTGYLLLTDYIKGVFKLDVNSGVIQSLAQFKRVQFAISNSDESAVYIGYRFGISVLNLTTSNIEKVVGSVEDRFIDPPLVPGRFDKITRLPDLASPNWLVKDEILALIAPSHGRLAILDLVNREVTYFCSGSKSYRNPLNSLKPCEFNKLNSMTVVNGETLYIAVQNESNFLSKMELEVATCKIPPTNKSVNRTKYRIHEFTRTYCRPGYGIDGTYDTVACEDPSFNDDHLGWNKPLPKCTVEEIFSISPLKGPIAGGTKVIVKGIISRNAIQIYMMIDGSKVNIDFKYELNMLIFRTPSQTSVGDTELTVKLTNHTYTQQFKFLDNPIVESISLAYVHRSGIFGSLTIMNRDSVNIYKLSFNETSLEITNLKRLEEKILLFSVAVIPFETPSDCAISVYGDGGIMVTGTIDEYLPSPEIFVSTDPLNKTVNDGNVELVFDGENIDVGFAKTFYTVYVKTPNRRIPCYVRLDDVTNTTLPCVIADVGLIPYNIHVEMKIYIGSLYIPAGLVLFKNGKHTGLQRTLGQLKSYTKQNSPLMPILTAVSSVVGLIIVVSLISVGKRKFFSHQQAITNGKSIPLSIKINTNIDFRLEELKIDSSNLDINTEDIIGQGNFGLVYKGLLQEGDKHHDVAVKTLKDGVTTNKEVEEFLKEALLVSGLEHLNVLSTLGVCLRKGSLPLIVFPYMSNGDLRSFIRRDDVDLTYGDLLHFAMQVASGMVYLSENKFVHRDLAARNCLVDKEYLVKIADFGLSRDIYSDDYYKVKDGKNTPLPVKWLALECLTSGRFDSRSDVWSYGILLWELCTRGSIPYADINQWDMKHYLVAGNRLHQTQYIPDFIYDKMYCCWDSDPDKRPTFMALEEFTSSLLNPPYTYTQRYTSKIPLGYVIGVH